MSANLKDILADQYTPTIQALGGNVLFEHDSFVLAKHNEKAYLLTYSDGQLELHLGLAGGSEASNLLDMRVGTTLPENILESNNLESKLELKLFGSEYGFNTNLISLPIVAQAQQSYFQNEIRKKMDEDVVLLKEAAGVSHADLIDAMSQAYKQMPGFSPYLFKITLEVAEKANLAYCASSLYKKMPIENAAQNVRAQMDEFEHHYQLLDKFFSLTPMARMLNTGKNLLALDVDKENIASIAVLESMENCITEPNLLCVQFGNKENELVEFYAFPSEHNATIDNRFLIGGSSSDLIVKMQQVELDNLSVEQQVEFSSKYIQSPPLTQEWTEAGNDIKAQMQNGYEKMLSELANNKKQLEPLLDSLLGKTKNLGFN